MEGIFVVLLICFVFKLLKDGRSMPMDQSFAAYAKAHPECVQNGAVRCCNCGGRNLWLRLHSSSFKFRINAHVCKNCGNELYRSVTPL